MISEIQNPFEIKESVFSSNTYSKATLTVPSSTKTKYQQTNYWNKFTNIQEDNSQGGSNEGDDNQGDPSVVAEAVDLGLSVKWASWNVGADTPEGLGNLYAWGELAPKTNYSSSTYKFYSNGYTKYGSVDNKYRLDSEDDVAQQKWGGKWRMPTYAEFEELKEKCTFTVTTLNGVPVTKVEGPNGNFIYFPYPGNYTGTTLYYKNSIGSYWSSDLKTDDYAKDLDFQSGKPYLNGDTRYHGQSVRPVYEESSDSPNLDNNGTVPDVVDLGLSSGRLWAAWNIGASAPEEYGSYFAWGETAPKSNYAWSTYKFGNGSNFSKYNSSDGLTELELEDDAAYVILGKDWRMPTHEEELELVNECSWESTTINGISGYKITGPNGNSIFMPRGGIYDGTDYASDGTKLSDANNCGWYWSSTLNNVGSAYAQGLCFFPSLISNVCDHERSDGHNIRPVYVGNVSIGSDDNNQLVVDNVSTSKGKTATFAIGLSNETTDLSAYQFDLTLPAGITLSKNDKGKFQVSKSDRYADDSQTLNVSTVEGSSNTYRFVCFSLSNSVIEGTSGAILNAVIDVANTVGTGSYEAQISNIVFTKSNGTQLQLNSVKFNIVVSNVTKGDANDDGEINVADIVEVVNYILGKPSAKFVEAAADLNDDGEINVTDIVKIVSIIMSTNNARLRASQVVESTDHDRLSLSESENHGLSLCLDNENGYVASQFDIHLSVGQTLDGIRLNDIRSNEHVLTYSKTDDNTYRVVVYSLDNQAYAGNSGELLSIQISGTGNVDIDNILFVTSGQKEKRFEPMYSYISTAIRAVENVENMDVYSIDGRLVRKQVMSKDDLKKGIYIINGKKHIVR